MEPNVENHRLETRILLSGDAQSAFQQTRTPVFGQITQSIRPEVLTYTSGNNLPDNFREAEFERRNRHYSLSILPSFAIGTIPAAFAGAYAVIQPSMFNIVIAATTTLAGVVAGSMLIGYFSKRRNNIL